MKYIVAFALMFMVSVSFAEPYQTDIDAFFENIKKGKVDEAVTAIYKSNPYVAAIPDQITNVKNQLNALPGLVGELNYLKKVDTYDINDLVVQITYVATYDRQPVRFEFQFFKVKSGWRIYSMSFDSDLTEDLQILARKQAISSEK